MQVIQHRRAELMQPGERPLHLRLDTRSALPGARARRWGSVVIGPSPALHAGHWPRRLATGRCDRTPAGPTLSSRSEHDKLKGEPT